MIGCPMVSKLSRDICLNDTHTHSMLISTPKNELRKELVTAKNLQNTMVTIGFPCLTTQKALLEQVFKFSLAQVASACELERPAVSWKDQQGLLRMIYEEEKAPADRR